MEMNNTTCNYCDHPIEKGTKRCSHCGTLNPSIRTKEALIWTVGMIVVFFIVIEIMDLF